MTPKKEKILITVADTVNASADALDVLRSESSLAKVFTSRGVKVEEFKISPRDFDDEKKLIDKIQKKQPSCIFNLFEGFCHDSKKEAFFVSLLENHKIPFTGNPSYALFLSCDKELAKRELSAAGIRVAKSVLIKDLSEISRLSFKGPFFVKPAFEDASLGVYKDSLVTKRKDLDAVVEDRLVEFPAGVLVEEFIDGKEYSAAFLGDYPYEMLGVSVLDYSQHKNSPPFLNYKSKWDKDSNEYKDLMPVIDKSIDPYLKASIKKIASEAARIIKCRSYFRVDLREKFGRLYVLDINPNPDINQDSGFMKLAYALGLTYKMIIERIYMI